MKTGHTRARGPARRLHACALAAAACLVLTSPAFAQSGPRDNDARFYAANGMLERGLYDLAAEEYRSFLEASPASEHADTARYGLAAALAATGDDAGALDALGALADPIGFEFAADAALLRGRAHLRIGAPAEAVDALAGLLERFPEHPTAPEAAALYVEALLGAGNAAQAAEAAETAAEFPLAGPVRQRMDLVWGIALVTTGDDAAGAQRFAEAARAGIPGPVADQAELLLAQSLERSGDDETAAQAYDNVLDGPEDARTPAALLGSARIDRRNGNDNAAAARLDRVIEGFGSSASAPEAALLRGRIALDAGDTQRAGALFAAVARVGGPLEDDAVYWGARAARASGDHADAAEALATFAGEYPQSELIPYAAYERAAALWASGNAEAAEPLFAAFGESHGDHELSPDALHALVQVRHELGNDEGTLRAARQFAARHADHPLRPEADFLAAESLFMLAEDERAAAAYEKWLTDHEDHEREQAARYRLGLTLARMGRFGDAEPLLEPAAALGVEDPFYRPALLALGDGRFAAGRFDDAEPPLIAFVRTSDDDGAVADANLKLGLSLLRLGRPADAVSPLTDAATAEGSEDRRAHASYALGRAQAANEEIPAARLTLESLVDSGQAGRFEAFACRELGLLARSEGRSADAERWFARAADAGTGEVAAESALDAGRTLLASGSYTEAAGRLREAMRLGEGSAVEARARASLVIALARDGSDDGAIAVGTLLVPDERAKVEPAVLAAVDYEIARCLMRSGDTEGAEELLTRVMTGSESSLAPYARLELAASQMNAEAFDEAAETLGPLLDQDLPADLEEPARYRAGVCAFELGDPQAVVDLLATFHEDFPDSDVSSSADLMCGESLVTLGRPGRAADHLERASADDVAESIAEPALLRLGEALATLQYWARSEEAFRAHQQRFSDSQLWFQSRFGLGWARENQGRRVEAIEDYREVADRHKGATAARAQFQIGECLFAEGDFEDAIRELVKVDILHAYPEWSAAALYEAGRCFEQLGRMAEAREQFRAVVDRFDDSEWAELSTERLERMTETAPPGRGS